MRRRTYLKSALGVGAGAVSTALATGALAQSSELVLNDFGSGYPGTNALGNWSTHEAFADSNVSETGLELVYDDAGWFASNVLRDVSAFDTLELEIRGTAGGEETDIQLEVGGVEDTLANMTDDEIGTAFGTVAVDLEAAGVDTADVDDVRLNFFQGGSSTVEIAKVAFVGPPGTPTTTPGGERLHSTYPEPSEGFPWEVEPGNEKEPENPISAAEIDESTTLAELCPTYTSEDAHMWVPRDFLDYLPGTGGDASGLDPTEDLLSDAQKADYFDVDLEAIQSKVNSGELTLGELGTQATERVVAYREAGMPVHAIAKLLPRIMLLPDGTEPLTWHKSSESWGATAGFQAATNDPAPLIQGEWPTDARSYKPDEKYERDRAHDQPDHETDAGWTAKAVLSDDYYYGDHSLEQAIRANEHPVTGQSLGSGFTANAPMAAKADIHVQNSNSWYMALTFENTGPIPHYIDAAVIWWVGPMGLSDLRNGHYNNRQRPGPGKGHPQRDIIETVYDEEASLSAYAIRIAQHDEPYHMRTAYPNQRWSLAQGVSAVDPVTGDDRFTSQAEKQEVVDTMLSTLHVELETNLDRNQELMGELRLRNRMTN